MDNNEKIRCGWATQSEQEAIYHDDEWGKPEFDDRELFERLILEGMQAGLSWVTILKKRENMRAAFDGFDPDIIVTYNEEKFNELMNNAGIIRNRLKINAVIENANAYFKVQEQYGSFSDFMWQYVHHEPIVNYWKSIEEVPPYTPLSEQISKDMKKLGFRFVGPTIIYAFMQSVGMVNDHLTTCFLHPDNK